MRILSIDTGVNECGIALFDGKDLILAELVKNPYKKVGTKVDTSTKIKLMGQALSEAIQNITIDYGSVDLCLVEYVSGFKMAGFSNVNTVARLCYMAGVAQGSLPRIELELVAPTTWKDKQDKLENHEHFLKNVSKKNKKTLDEFLKSVPNGKRHNVLDAVGIGLYGIKHYGESV